MVAISTFPHLSRILSSRRYPLFPEARSPTKTLTERHLKWTAT
jgi:hypothetical protein